MLTPRMGAVGWVGSVILSIVIVVLSVLAGIPWWGELLIWVFVIVIPVELLRLDAIEGSHRA